MTEEEAVHLSNISEAAQLVSSAIQNQLLPSDDNVRLLSDVVRGLPSLVVQDLSYVGVCGRCILRLFGIREYLYDNSSLSPSILSSVSGDTTNLEKSQQSPSNSPTGKESEDRDMIICSLCLGIMQFTYCDDKDLMVKKESGSDLAISIADIIKKEGHQVDSFSLEVSIPPVILANERSVWLYLKRKYGSEQWFQRVSLCISVKDALKISVIKPLETMLDCKANASTFHIRLVYIHPKPSIIVQNFAERNQSCKRRKTGTSNDLETVHDGHECSDSSTIEADAILQRSLESLQDGELSGQHNFPLDKVSKPCQLTFSCCRSHIYIGGRYMKYSRNVSQTRWIIDDERMGEASVEELIGNNVLPMCCGDSYKFHAAGREDIDVRMLGSGRPFLVEISNARQVPSEESVKCIETEINNMENKLVRVKNLTMVDNQVWTTMREGEAEKQKQYAALVWISRPLDDKDLQSISSCKEMHILQKTPIRVLHRRSPLEREKIIHWMRIERIVGSSQYFLLYLCTQAGTYIKEFVHGDLGRTIPSIGSILCCRAEILQLDVTDVKMDCFLTQQGVL